MSVCLFSLLSNNSTHSITQAFFAAYSKHDYEGGLVCGACARLTYQGRTVEVNIVDRWSRPPTGGLQELRAGAPLRPEHGGLGGPHWRGRAG